jgi:hypothetical protein
MTVLKKPVRRTIQVLQRPAVIVLDPEISSIRIRSKGCRREYRLHFDLVFRLAMEATARAEKPARKRRGLPGGGPESPPRSFLCIFALGAPTIDRRRGACIPGLSPSGRFNGGGSPRQG